MRGGVAKMLVKEILENIHGVDSCFPAQPLKITSTEDTQGVPSWMFALLKYCHPERGDSRETLRQVRKRSCCVRAVPTRHAAGVVFYALVTNNSHRKVPPRAIALVGMTSRAWLSSHHRGGIVTSLCGGIAHSLANPIVQPYANDFSA